MLKLQVFYWKKWRKKIENPQSLKILFTECFGIYSEYFCVNEGEKKSHIVYPLFYTPFPLFPIKKRKEIDWAEIWSQSQGISFIFT